MSNRTAVAVSFTLGFTVASLFRYIENRRAKKKNRLNAGAGPEGTDFSLFWGPVETLTQTPQSKKFLPSEVYSKLVRDCVVCCVDCVIVRHNPLTNRKECLLLERSTEPAKGLWWLPGGRLFKGETFFDCATRKAKEETGLEDVTPIQVLGFYNTFFPTSAWDSKEEKGTQTVAPIILMEIGEDSGDASGILLDKTSERYRWIGLDPEEAISNKEDKYVVGALLRLQAWDSTYGKTRIES